MIFAPRTKLKIDRVGITSTSHSNPRGNRLSVQIREPEPVNILTAMAENESMVKNESDPERKAIALAWLFHLVGDIHQPLHTAQLFTVDYPKGDRGGNEICVRVTQAGQPMDLHRFWDGVITSSSESDHGYETRQRRSETAKSFSGASSPNLRTPTLSRGQKRASRLRRRSLTVTVDGLGVRKVGIRTARWSQRLPCFLWATLLVRAGLLIEG